MMVSTSMMWRAFIGLLVVGVLVSHGTAGADGDDNKHGDDHDRAYLSRDRGDIKPLREILDGLGSKLPKDSEIIAMELEHEGGAWVYEFKVIDKTGRRYEVCVDAKTGQFLGEEDKDHACSSGRGRSTDRSRRRPRPFGSRLYRGGDD